MTTARADGLPAKARLLALLQEAMRDHSFVRLTLGGHLGADRTLKNVLVRPVVLREQPQLSFVYRHATKDITKNVPPEEGLARLDTLIGPTFRTAHLSTTRHTAELEFQRGREPRFSLGRPTHTTKPSLAHDRSRRQALPVTQAPWLTDLGVTSADGKVAKGMEAKFRQIQKFVEILQPLLVEAFAGASPEAPTERGTATSSTSRPAEKVQLVDMGSGKGYLTFAAYECLRRVVGSRGQVLGIEARPELVQLCQQTARKYSLEGLRFQAGAITEVAPDHLDVLLALHACDTATDDALARGVQAQAKLLLVSPCCHKELRPQLQPPPVLRAALKHGILLEREAEFVTDALRAALLEWASYDTLVFEFISTEHTSKNLMIAGIRRRADRGQDTRAQAVRELAGFYGIRSQRLATQLGFVLHGQNNRAPGHD
jgi:hypothetical protein